MRIRRIHHERIVSWDIEENNMNRIKIQKAVTNYGTLELFEPTDEKSKEIRDTVNDWANKRTCGRREGSKLVFDYGNNNPCPYTREDVLAANFVDEIFFYPEEHKFESVCKGKVFKTIIAAEYSVSHFRS
jgi:hypothetical protein